MVPSESDGFSSDDLRSVAVFLYRVTCGIYLSLPAALMLPWIFSGLSVAQVSDITIQDQIKVFGS